MNTPLDPIERPALTVRSTIFLTSSELWQANADDVSALLSTECCTRRTGFNISETKIMIEGGLAFWMESGICPATQVDRLFSTV